MWDLRPLAFALEFGRKDIANMLLDQGPAIPVAPGAESYRLFFSGLLKWVSAAGGHDAGERIHHQR